MLEKYNKSVKCDVSWLTFDCYTRKIEFHVLEQGIHGVSLFRYDIFYRILYVRDGPWDLPPIQVQPKEYL